MAQDVEVAIKLLEVFEEGKSQFNLVVLNITTYDIDVEMRNIVDGITSRLQMLQAILTSWCKSTFINLPSKQVPENEVNSFTNTSTQHREISFRAAYDLSYINDIFGTVGQEISAILDSGDFESLRLTYNTFLMYQLELGKYYYYFLNTLNFNEEGLIVFDSLEGLVCYFI